MGKVINFLKGIGETIEDALFVDYSCIVCGAEIDSNSKTRLCEDCINKFPFLDTKNICAKCGAPLNSITNFCDDCKLTKFDFDEARASFEYTNDAKRLVLAIKYANAKYLAKYFAKYMYETFLNWGVVVDLIIPVPLSEKRQKSRGYNQSELLAEEFSNFSGIEVCSEKVVRIDSGKTQQHSTRKERFDNMKGVFKLNDKTSLEGKNILIIDDVYTTGATVNELSKTLRKLKPDKIYVLTAGKTLFHNNKDKKKSIFSKLFLANNS